tara:strand:- start:14998 stop:15393 length:396 start_codon:yes stop_codon:yes gene_type:complete
MSEQPLVDAPCRPLPLGTLEQHVMDALWDSGPCTIREVITALGSRHAYTTIATVLANLDRKELVISERDGRSVTYSARCTREQHAARLMEIALATSRDRATAILHFVATLEPHERELLRNTVHAEARSTSY